MTNRVLEFWGFVGRRLHYGDSVMLLVVAESSGSSPGRRGYKMAVASNGEIFGSIGGGIMEVNLVEESRRLLSVAPAVAGGLSKQVHRRNSEHASGMICSGEQTVVLFQLSRRDIVTIDLIVNSLSAGDAIVLELTDRVVRVVENNPPATAGGTDKSGPLAHADDTDLVIENNEFRYTETLGTSNRLFIIGGGHCALALSELMSKLDFRISLFDDRPELNTIEKNRFADEITIVESYDDVASHIAEGDQSYVVVMTLGYKTDAEAIRSLIGKDLKYFGVLGSNAKMATMLRELVKEGVPREILDRIRTPIGLQINSRTPEEIAVSIAAEIISVKNAE